MMGKRSLIAVVDDDESVRESLPDLLREFGFVARAFSTAEAFLASEVVSEANCLILDVAMPGMSGSGTATRTEPPAAGDSNCLHHRQRRPDGPSAPAREGRSGVPVQAVQRGGAARRAEHRAGDEGSMTTMNIGEVGREPYTSSSAIAAPSIEVNDVGRHIHRLCRRRRRLGARIAGAVDQNRRLATRNVRLRTRVPLPSSSRGSVLPGARCDAAWAQRSRVAAATRRADRHADHLHHRTRRRADERAGDEGGSRRIPDQAVQGRCAVGRHSQCYRAKPHRTPSGFGAAAFCGSATRHSRRANAK